MWRLVRVYLIVCDGNSGPTEHCSGLREHVSLKELIRA
jgi:hypothetical protein